MRRKLSRLPAARALASAVSTTSYGGAATRLTISRGGRRARNGRINATRILFHAHGHGPESALEPGFADRRCGPAAVRRRSQRPPTRERERDARTRPPSGRTLAPRPTSPSGRSAEHRTRLAPVRAHPRWPQQLSLIHI